MDCDLFFYGPQAGSHAPSQIRLFIAIFELALCLCHVIVGAGLPLFANFRPFSLTPASVWFFGDALTGKFPRNGRPDLNFSTFAAGTAAVSIKNQPAHERKAVLRNEIALKTCPGKVGRAD